MKNPAEQFNKIILIILIVSSFLLLFPSVSRLPVFSGGDFVFAESVGLIVLSLALVYSLIFFLNKKTAPKKPKLRSFSFIYHLLIVLSCMILFLFLTGLIWIRHEVRSLCLEATRTYGRDCVSAAQAMLVDQNQSYSSRNKAVWVLGQLADKKALPMLKKYYTRKIPGHESRYHTLSQYELQKAIKWCEEGNITSWLYFDRAFWN